MSKDKELILTEYSWKLVQDVITTSGKLKGSIQSLAKDIQASSNNIALLIQNVHDDHKDLHYKVVESSEKLGKLSAKLEQSPFVKLYDKQTELNNTFSTTVSETMSKFSTMEKSIEILDLSIKENNKVVEGLIKSQSENTKEKWKFWGIVVAGIFTTIGAYIAGKS